MKRFVRTIKLALLRDKMKSQKERSAELYKSRKESGLCPRCGKPLDRDGHYCSECLEKEREYRSETKKFCKENGICPVCHKEKLYGDEKQCILCREYHWEYGIKNPPTDQQKEKYRNRFRETQKKLYAERVSNGICTRCGKLKVVPGRKKCGICLEKDMILHRNRRAYEVELQQTK